MSTRELAFDTDKATTDSRSPPQPLPRVEGDCLVVEHKDWLSVEIRAHGSRIEPDRDWIEAFDLALAACRSQRPMKRCAMRTTPIPNQL